MIEYSFDFLNEKMLCMINNLCLLYFAGAWHTASDDSICGKHLPSNNNVTDWAHSIFLCRPHDRHLARAAAAVSTDDIYGSHRMTTVRVAGRRLLFLYQICYLQVHLQ